jgi:signal transduction histidine kinase
VHPLATEKSIEFVCSVEPSLEKAFVDPDRLSQILTNLIANAIKFSPVHGAVSLSVSRSNNQILFRVKDSGPGIAPAELPHVFDQYWQAKHGKPGAGLGLYICKGLVEAHGGKIWIETGVGEGTTVCFTIPAVKPATLAA